MASIKLEAGCEAIRLRSLSQIWLWARIQKLFPCCRLFLVLFSRLWFVVICNTSFTNEHIEDTHKHHFVPLKDSPEKLSQWLLRTCDEKIPELQIISGESTGTCFGLQFSITWCFMAYSHTYTPITIRGFLRLCESCREKQGGAVRNCKKLVRLAQPDQVVRNSACETKLE